MSFIEDRYLNGVLVQRFIDNRDGTGSEINYDEDENITSEVALSNLPIPSYPPLDEIGALATLLVVLDIIPIQDAANVIHEEPEHLIAEAQAWSLG